MSRIYWDTMLFIYLLEDHAVYAPRVRQLLERAYKRRDALYTSYLALGEIMAGAEKSPQPTEVSGDPRGHSGDGLLIFAVRRRSRRAVQQAPLQRKTENRGLDPSCCAASAGIDLFLTGDRQLLRMDIPGIQFIADFDMPIL